MTDTSSEAADARLLFAAALSQEPAPYDKAAVGEAVSRAIVRATKQALDASGYRPVELKPVR